MRAHEDRLSKGDTSKASESEPLTLIPSTSFQFSPKGQSPSGQKVSFLGPPPGFSQLSEPERTQGSQKRPRIGSSSLHESHPPAKQRAPTPFRDASNENSETDTSVEISRRDLRATTCSSSEFMAEAEVDSSHNPAGSTIAEALNYKSRRNDNESSDGESMFTTVGLPETSRGQGLKSSSRALIKEHFQTNETFVLPQGHPVIAFTENQLSSVLKIVADEAVRASQDALEGIIQKTRRLSLEAPVRSPATPATVGSRSSLRSRSTSPGLLSDTSGVLRSDEELSSIGYTYERNDAEQIFAPPRAAGFVSSGHLEPRGEGVDASVGSPGAQTLAALKAEAIKDKAKTDDPTSMLFDVVAPIQSYLKNAVRGLDALTSDASIARFLELEMTFGNAGLSSTYCPWDGINHFDRVGIQECINSQSTVGRKVTLCVDSDPQGSSKSPKKSQSSSSGRSPKKTQSPHSSKQQEQSSSRTSSIERGSRTSGSPHKH